MAVGTAKQYMSQVFSLVQTNVDNDKHLIWNSQKRSNK